MRNLPFHIFLLLLAFVILFPIIWVFIASFVEPTQSPFLIERILAPESIKAEINGNQLKLNYKLTSVKGNHGILGEKGEIKYIFGQENANMFVVIKINTYNSVLEYEVLSELNKDNLDNQWIVHLKLDNNANIIKESFTINKKSLLTFFNVVTFQNYRDILWDPGFRSWLSNSLIISFFTGFISIFLGFFAGYAFSRWKFPGRRISLLWILATQLFPLAMMIVPFYILAAKIFPAIIPGLQLVNNLFGLILVYSATALPFSIWMLKGYFDTVPIDLEEAAAIDGASLLQLLWYILFPLTRPALFTAFLFAFVQAWNEYAIASIFMTEAKNYTLPLGLKTLLANNNIAGFATAAILVSIPIVVLFISMKKELVEGATLGAVKG